MKKKLKSYLTSCGTNFFFIFRKMFCWTSEDRKHVCTCYSYVSAPRRSSNDPIIAVVPTLVWVEDWTYKSQAKPKDDFERFLETKGQLPYTRYTGDFCCVACIPAFSNVSVRKTAPSEATLQRLRTEFQQGLPPPPYQSPPPFQDMK